MVVGVGVDDTGFVSVFPEVSGTSDGAVVSYGDSGVEVLHGSVEVIFGGGGDDVVVVGHEDDVVEVKVVFLGGFIQGVEDDADDLSLVEPEGSVVGSADEVVGVFGLDDA